MTTCAHTHTALFQSSFNPFVGKFATEEIKLELQKSLKREEKLEF